MREPRRLVTTKTLAVLAGLSQSTVSLALRNDPRIRPETRKRIAALARKQGYRPDPALSALVAYRARTRPAGEYGTIAVLHDHDPRRDPPMSSSLRQQMDGMRERAGHLGYTIELFQVHSDAQSALRLGRMLHARGIRGLILTALRMPALPMKWEHFSAVVIGEYFSRPQLNHVNHHHSSVLTTTYQELRKLGYRRIGFCNSGISEERKHHLYLGAYLKCLYLDGLAPEDSPPLLFDADTNWSPLPWLDRHGFDAVMAMVPSRFLEKLKGSAYRVPRRLGIAGYAIPPDAFHSRIAGCTLDYRRMGAVAVDLLQSMLHRGQRGVPPKNEHYDLLLHGQWQAGDTVRRMVGSGKR